MITIKTDMLGIYGLKSLDYLVFIKKERDLLSNRQTQIGPSSKWRLYQESRRQDWAG
jgi:hypothetical protein